MRGSFHYLTKNLVRNSTAYTSKFEGIQVSSCKSLCCENFGVPAKNTKNDPNQKVSGSTKSVLYSQNQVNLIDLSFISGFFHACFEVE